MIFWLLVFVFVGNLVFRFRRSWNRTSKRLDHVMDTRESPCRWSNYASYRICLTHGIREDQPYATPSAHEVYT
jgi:hypothetical protein